MQKYPKGGENVVSGKMMKKDKGTFIVKIHECQNATWQGEILWLENKVKQHFSSALELIKLIDSALGEYDI